MFDRQSRKSFLSNNKDQVNSDRDMAQWQEDHEGSQGIDNSCNIFDKSGNMEQSSKFTQRTLSAKNQIKLAKQSRFKRQSSQDWKNMAPAQAIDRQSKEQEAPDFEVSRSPVLKGALYDDTAVNSKRDNKSGSLKLTHFPTT